MSIDWTFGGSWPHEPRFHDTDAGRLHYVDVGARRGQPVVLLHGNPTWGYLYRKVIPQLTAAGHRAIAVDHLGFGRSDKPHDVEAYRIGRHARRLAGLLDSLRLEEPIVVLHDWSGPIALPWIADHADRVGGLFVLNTFAPRLPGPLGARGSIRALRTPGLGSWLVKSRNVPVEQFLFKAGLSHPERLDEQAKAAYRAPHMDKASRVAMLMFPRQIPFGDKDPVAELTARSATLLQERAGRTPAAICWGMRDILFGEEVLGQWSRLLPHANVTRLPDAGHVVQEDAGERVAETLLALVDSARPMGRTRGAGSTT